MRVTLRAREQVACARERLDLDVRRVWRGAPPRRAGPPAAVRRDDEVRALLVQPLPELPPRGRAAVAEVEVDGGSGDEQLWRAHALQCLRGGLRRRKQGLNPSPRPPAPRRGTPSANTPRAARRPRPAS